MEQNWIWRTYCVPLTNTQFFIQQILDLEDNPWLRTKYHILSSYGLVNTWMLGFIKT